MPYVVITSYTRPNSSVAWHTSQSFDSSILDPYIEMMFTFFHGRKTRTVSEPDENTLQIEMVWESKEVYDDYVSRAETIAIQQAINDYNDSVGVILQPREKFEI